MLEHFETQWKQLKSTVKAKWAKLTDEDLASVAGKKDNLVVEQAPVEEPASKKTRAKKTDQSSVAAN
jgi:uncharacterized protein YjbJ (UPF0337 family)